MATSVTETVARGLKQYVSPLTERLVKKSIGTQMKEINGLIPFDKGRYHSQAYESLVKKTVDSRGAYRQTQSIGQRKIIANESLRLWKDYVENRKSELPEDYQLTDKMKSKFLQVWDIVKDRHEKTLNPSKVLRLHEEYINLFKFEIPIDAKNLARMIHPHYGYLTHYPGKIHFEELMELYANNIVSGYEDYMGQVYFASELAAYAYWVSFDKDLKGYMTLSEFSDFLKIFRLSSPTSSSDFANEFKFTLEPLAGEFNAETADADNIVSFDFLRHLFLERNL